MRFPILPMVMPIALLATNGCTIIPRADMLPTRAYGPPTEMRPDGEPERGIALAAIHQRVFAGGPYVTPLAVLEDSRCPINARCVWAGRVRISVRIDLGSHAETREIGTDAPIQVGDGQLSLVEVHPDKVAGGAIADPAAYRFGFKFAGGL